MKSPKIVIRNAVLEGATPNTMRKAKKNTSVTNKVDLKPFYFECFTHSWIIIYGVLILLFKFYNPFNS